MKVFISWSGDRSKLLAVALRDWLQPILQSVEVWMSETDIDAGDRWGQEVARELSSSNFGIICITPENAGAPWVLFEAGALAKSLEGSKVIPILFELELRNISGPLAQFQAKKFDRPGLSEVASSINKTLPNPITDIMLKSLLDAMWPSLQQKIESVPKREGNTKSTRSQAEILEELVAGVRGFDARLRDAEVLASDRDFRQRRKKTRYFMPMIAEISSELGGNDPIGLLMIAGVFREEFPWLSEVLVEAYREIRRGNSGSYGRLVERIRRITRMALRSPFIEEMGGNKEHHMLLIELPIFLERYFEQLDSRRPVRDSKAEDKSSHNPSSLP